MRRCLIVLTISACGRGRFDTLADATPDATPDATIDALDLGPWQPSQALTALNSTSDDSDPEIRGDGLELLFHSNRPGGTGGYDIYRSLRATTADSFPPPTLVAGVNTNGDELGPSLSRDGLTLFFSNGQDIVFATRADLGAGFGPTQMLPALSSADVDTTPELSGDGLVAIVTRGTVSTRDLWIYARSSDGPPNSGWSAGTHAADLASPVTDASPDLDQQGLTVHFHSDRLGADDDIYVATRSTTLEKFGTPTVVDVVSTVGDEGDPTLTADARTIVFHLALQLHLATR